MVPHTNLSTQEAKAGGSLEFEASLYYRVSFRTTRATQRNLILKNLKKKKMAKVVQRNCIFDRHGGARL